MEISFDWMFGAARMSFVSARRHECAGVKVRVMATVKETEIACVSGRGDSSWPTGRRQDPALKDRSEKRIMRKAGPCPTALLFTHRRTQYRRLFLRQIATIRVRKHLLIGRSSEGDNKSALKST